MLKLDRYTFNDEERGPSMDLMRKNLSILLDHTGLTKIEISNHLDIHRNQLRNFLKGESNLTSQSFCRLLEFLSIDLTSIISDKTKKTIYNEESGTFGEATEKMFKHLSKTEKKVLLKTLTSFTSTRTELKDTNDFLEKLFLKQN